MYKSPYSAQSYLNAAETLESIANNGVLKIVEMLRAIGEGAKENLETTGSSFLPIQNFDQRSCLLCEMLLAGTAALYESSNDPQERKTAEIFHLTEDILQDLREGLEKSRLERERDPAS